MDQRSQRLHHQGKEPNPGRGQILTDILLLATKLAVRPELHANNLYC